MILSLLKEITDNFRGEIVFNFKHLDSKVLDAFLMNRNWSILGEEIFVR